MPEPGTVYHGLTVGQRGLLVEVLAVAGELRDQVHELNRRAWLGELPADVIAVKARLFQIRRPDAAPPH
jgi:hypothetical protein